MNKYSTLWINVNRKCNLQCSWCYSKNTSLINNDEISLDLAKRIVNLAKELNINHISLIGGEPTLYTYIYDIIKYITTNTISVGIITNGLKLANKKNVQKLIDAGLDSVNISIKGYSNKNYYQNTGVKGYNTALIAIRNLSQFNINYCVSMVLNGENIDDFLLMVKDAVDYGAKSFYFSFEFNFDFKKYNTDDFYKNIFILIETFSKKYDELNNITDGNFILHQTFPLCIWDNNLLEKMNKNNQLSTTCQLLQQNGLIFDTKGELILCNALYDYPIGKYNFDFKNSFELQNFVNSKKQNTIFQKLLSYPSKECMNCDLWNKCGGGCISNWLHFSLHELIKQFKIYKNSDKKHTDNQGIVSVNHEEVERLKNTRKSKPIEM